MAGFFASFCATIDHREDPPRQPAAVTNPPSPSSTRSSPGSCFPLGPFAAALESSWQSRRIAPSSVVIGQSPLLVSTSNFARLAPLRGHRPAPAPSLSIARSCIRSTQRLGRAVSISWLGRALAGHRHTSAGSRTVLDFPPSLCDYRWCVVRVCCTVYTEHTRAAHLSHTHTHTPLVCRHRRLSPSSASEHRSAATSPPCCHIQPTYLSQRPTLPLAALLCCSLRATQAPLPRFSTCLPPPGGLLPLARPCVAARARCTHAVGVCAPGTTLVLHPPTLPASQEILLLPPATDTECTILKQVKAASGLQLKDHAISLASIFP